MILRHPRQTVVWAFGADPTDPMSTNWVAFSSSEGLRQAWASERSTYDAIQHDLKHGTWFGQADAPPEDPKAMRDYYRKEQASHQIIIRDLELLARQGKVRLHARIPPLLPGQYDQFTAGRITVVSPELILWCRSTDGKILRIASRPHVTSHHWMLRAAFRDGRTGRVRRPWAAFSVPSVYVVPSVSDRPLHKV